MYITIFGVPKEMDSGHRKTLKLVWINQISLVIIETKYRGRIYS